MQNFSGWLRHEHINIMESKQGNALKSSLVLGDNNLQGKVLFKCCSWHDQGEGKTLSIRGFVYKKIHIWLAFMWHKPMALKNHFGLQQKQTHIHLILSIT